MMFNYVSDGPAPVIGAVAIPFFEDAKAENSSGHATSKTPEKLQAEVSGLLAQLGGAAIRFEPVKFETKPLRYGYIVRFVLISTNDSAIPCKVPIAGLPMRAETPVRKQAVLAQALFAFRESLQGELNALRYRPGYSPLAVHMLDVRTGKTVMETIAEQAALASGDLLLPGGAS